MVFYYGRLSAFSYFHIRGIENGLFIARSAREGGLTISDNFGRVREEAISADQNEASLIGNISHEITDTICSKTGYWFSIINLLAAILILSWDILKRYTKWQSY